MTVDQSLATLILLGVLALFISGQVRHDVSAMIALAAVALADLVPADEIFDGFGHPAVVTVAAVLIISAALNKSGVVDLAARRLGPYTEHPLQHILVLTSVVAVLSAFINNVGALALMMPVALATAAARERSPSILLMPLAFAAILGGMTTLIGTPPNIIVASIRGEALGAPFTLFDFTPVGLAVAAVGVLFVALIGWRLLPKSRQSTDPQHAIFTVGGYLAELRVPEGSSLAGRPMREAHLFYEQGANVFGIERNEVRLPAIGYRLLAAGDVLLVRASTEMLQRLVDEYGLEIASERRDRGLTLDREIEWKDATLLEAVVSPGSPLIGRSARLVDRVFSRNVTLLALARDGAPIRGRLRDQSFAAGDVALLQGENEALNDIIDRFRLWPLAERGLSLGEPTQPWLALGIFVAAILLGATGLVPIALAFSIAVVVYVLSGLLPIRDLYDGVDWPVIVLLGAMFPLGAALQATGTTSLFAASLVDAASAFGMAPWGLMALVLVATMFLSDIINNAATAVLMAPLSLEIADSLGAQPDGFLMAVAVGASCAFLTPIGHQCNTLVMGPGGYKFSDYWRMGLPLEVVIVAVAVPDDLAGLAALTCRRQTARRTRAAPTERRGQGCEERAQPLAAAWP